MNISADYVTGFCEGEAAFTYCTTYGSVVPCFSVRQTSSGEDVLRAIQAFFGIGRVYVCKARLPTKASSYYRVSRKDDLEVIVLHFTDYPLQGAIKQLVFAKWSALVDAYRYFRPDQVLMSQLAGDLSALQLRPRRRKMQECGENVSTV